MPGGPFDRSCAGRLGLSPAGVGRWMVFTACVHERRNSLHNAVRERKIGVRISGEVFVPLIGADGFQNMICVGDELEFRAGIGVF